MNLIQFLAMADAGSRLALPGPVRDLLKSVAGADFDWDEALARIPSEREARRCHEYLSRLEAAAPRLIGAECDLLGEIGQALEAVEDRLRALEAA